MIPGLLTRWTPAAPCLVLTLAAAPVPLTNEDIVRLVTHGTPEKTILREIEARPVDFDLSPGVVEELARVGVRPPIIEAMRRRQAEMPRPAGAGPSPSEGQGGAVGGDAAAAPEPAGRLMLAFAATLPGDDRPADPILAITSLPKGAPRPDGAEIGTVTDLALAILCTSGDHVPDHWDSRTPLREAPRHEVLLFRPGGSPGREKGFDVILLSREPAGPIPLKAGGHALLLGLAGKQTGSGSWRLLAADAIRVDVPQDGTVRLTLEAHSRIAGSRMIGFHLAQTWKVRLDPQPPAGEAPR
jgi:hypothetical protein